MPYNQVFQQYYNQALQGIDDPSIPPELRDYIRQYFSNLDPNAPGGPIFQHVTIEDLGHPGPSDAVLSSLGPHQVHDPARARPEFGALALSASSITVVSNALLLRREV